MSAMRGIVADTFPKLLNDRAARFGARAALREKEYGIWQTRSWSEVRCEVRLFAGGLAALGFRRGDKLAIIGDNRPAMYMAMCAAQALGGIPVPLYQDAVADEMQYVLDHSEARFILAENQEQVDKVDAVRDKCSRVETVIYTDPRGMRNYVRDDLHGYASLLERGAAFNRADPACLEREIAHGGGGDIAILLYTSGTTGSPKGVALSHDNVLLSSQYSVEFDRLDEHEEVLAYLPMAWVGDHIFSYGQSYYAGFCVSCPESSDTVMHDMREIGPTYFFAPPRIFENILTTVMVRMEDAGFVKRVMFRYFMGVARRVGARILDGRKVSLPDRIQYLVGGCLVYNPLKDTMGFSRVRLAYTAGEAIGPEIFNFYRSLGMNIKQLYGQTEASVFITAQPDGEVHPDTVGVRSPGVELRFGENNEVMYRSAGVFQYYFKNPEATAATRTADGWVHTGDAGFLDERGHLHIVDRARDVGCLNDGTMFAPKYIENKLKFFPHIKEAVAFGDGCDYCSVFINIDLEAVGSWAERRGVSWASYQELAAHPGVYEMIRDSIEEVNRDLAADKRLAGSQIRRFLVLHKELDADDGELTRTRKVRRRHIAAKYAVLIDALYSDRDHCHIEIAVRFEDGRSGAIAGDLRIMELRRSATHTMDTAARPEAA